MADTASNSAALHRGKGIGSGLPLSMTPEEIAVAKNHVITAWWPQLCRSSRMTDTGMFEEGWYNDAGLLDIHNPAFWKILNALASFSAHLPLPSNTVGANKHREPSTAKSTRATLPMERRPSASAGRSPTTRT